MSIISLSMLTESSNIDNVFDKKNIDENYFYTTLEFLKESHNELINSKKVLYKSLLESNNDQVVITESFKGFYEKCLSVIDKFLNFIKSLFKRFVKNLNRLVLSDGYLNKHMKDLDKFDSSFVMKGYKFTIDSDIPKINALAAFNKGFVGINFDEMIKKDPTEQLKYINKLYDSVVHYDYDVFRENVLGRNYPISASDYPSELFMVFRDTASTKYPITIEKEEVNLSRICFSKYKEKTADVEKLKLRIEKDYKEVKNCFKKMISKSESGDLQGLLIDANDEYSDNRTSIKPITKESMSKVDLFIKGKIDQVSKMSDIHATAFAAKLQALKDQCKQDKEVMYKALSYVYKDAYKKVNEESSTLDNLECVSYFTEESLGMIGLKRFINEAELIGRNQNSIENIQALDEAVADAIKNAILKVMQAIATIWRKFVESIDTLVKTEKNYLDKYKDLILKKQMADYTFTMYNYPNALKGVLNNATVPQFNYQAMKDHLNSDGDFVKQYFGNFAENYNPDDQKQNFRSLIIQKFRGSDTEIPIKSADLNMTDLFNFCYNYNTIETSLKKDIDTIGAGANAGLKLIDGMTANNQAGNTSVNVEPPKVTDQAKKEKEQGTPQPTPHDDSAIYQPLDMKRQYWSSIYEEYINEFEAQSNSTGSSTPNNPSGIKKTFATPGANTNTSQAPQQNPNDSNNAVKGAVAGQNNDQVALVKTQINRYLTICGQFMKAKEDVYQEIYKTYMIIIKMHVRDNLKNAGDNNKTGNKDADQATQYQSGDNGSVINGMINGNGEAKK